VAFVNSDILIDALVEEKPEALARLRGLIERLNAVAEEKLAISVFVYDNVISRALEKGKDPLLIMKRLLPPHTIYFWLEPVSHRIIHTALTAMKDNPRTGLTLAEWTALIWMAENDVNEIASDRKEIDALLLDPDGISTIPRITGRLRAIRRV
jgi:hypothetical protein